MKNKSYFSIPANKIKKQTFKYIIYYNIKNKYEFNT
jgi:hypothetical protein